MARPKISDFLHGFRFHVTFNGLSGGSQPDTTPGPGGVIAAGFTACSIPEVTEEAVEYREGHYIYAQKMVGIPKVGDIALKRGVALLQSPLWTWVKDTIEGNSEYRADVSILHLHRNAKPQTTSETVNPMPIATTTGPTAPTSYLEYACANAFPISYKAASDLDGTASEISIQELTLATESFDIIQH